MTRLLFIAALISTLIACQSPVDSGAAAERPEQPGARQVVIRATMLMMKMVDPARLDDFSIVEVIGEPADIEESSPANRATLRGVAARVLPAGQVERAVRAMDETVDIFVMGNPEVVVPLGTTREMQVCPDRLSQGPAQPRSPIEPWMLRVRPTSSDRGAPIRLKLTPAVDLKRYKEMGELAAGVPVPQPSETTVLIKPGQTIVVAGLFPVLEVTSSYDRKTREPDASKSAPAEVVAIISVSEIPAPATVAAK